MLVMKLCNISDVLKIFLYAAMSAITCLLIWLMFYTTDEAKALSSDVITHMSSVNKDLSESDITKYEDDEITGSEVINCIQKNLGGYTDTETAPIHIHVTTSTSVNTYTNATNIADIDEFASTRYIKPTAIFIGSIIRNENDIIIGLKFIQK